MKSKIIPLLMLVVLGGLIGYSFLTVSSLHPGYNLGEFYVQNSVEDTGAINLVAAILFDYRAFDTIGEATVIYTAVSIIMLLGPHTSFSFFQGKFNPLVKITIGLAMPLILAAAFYIVFYGHLYPGGGFPGGVILAAGAIIFGTTYGITSLNYKIEPYQLHLLENSGANFLILIGLAGMLAGSNFLASGQAGFYLGESGELLSSGSIPLFNLGVGIKVGAGLTSIYLSFARD